jgi:quinol monooxygenase YgiN
MIRIVAIFRCGSDQSLAVEAVLKSMIAPTRAEPGCRAYELFRIADGFLLDEVYQNDDAVTAHRASTHYSAYRDAITPLLRSPIEVLRPIPVE